MPVGSERRSFTHQRTVQLTTLTWNLGSELGDDGGAVAFGRAGAQGEGVCRARVEACEHVGGLVAQLHYLPTLVGEVQLGVKRAHGLVGDLGRKWKKNKKTTRNKTKKWTMNIQIVLSSILRQALLFSREGFCIHSMKTFNVGGIQVVWQGKTFTVLAALRISNSTRGGEGHPVFFFFLLFFLLSLSPVLRSLIAEAAKQFEKRLVLYFMCAYFWITGLISCTCTSERNSV